MARGCLMGRSPTANANWAGVHPCQQIAPRSGLNPYFHPMAILRIGRRLRSRQICPDKASDMNQQKPPPNNRDSKPRPPKWSAYWYLPIMLLLLWAWQSAVMQFAYHTIPYSEFKDHVRKGEIAECTIKETTVEGTIKTKPSTEGADASTNSVAERIATNAAANSKTTAKKDFF